MLPIGGPGKALTARDQANILFEAAGVKPNFFPVSGAGLRESAAFCTLRTAVSPPPLPSRCAMNTPSLSCRCLWR